MRIILCGAILALALCAQEASVEGVAVNSVNGQPLAGVHVRLFSSPPGGFMNEEGQFGRL